MNKQSSGDQLVFPNKQNSLDFVHLVVVVMCAAIGTGPSKLGYLYRCGVILGPLLMTIFGLISAYNMYLFVVVGCKYHGSTFEEMWTPSYGSKFTFIITFISVGSTLLVNMFYTSTLVGCVQSIVAEFIDDPPIWMTDYWVLSLLFSFFLLLPFILNQSLRFLAHVMWFKTSLILILVIIMVYAFGEVTAKNGFDPNKQIVYFRFDSSILGTIGSVFTSYLITPLGFPSIKHLKNATRPRLVKVFFWQTFCCWAIYNIMGIFTYLTFFDTNEGGIVFDFYENKLLKVVGYSILSIMLLLTLLSTINPSRYILIHSLFKTDELPPSIWNMVGICLQLAGVCLGSSTTLFNLILSILADGMSPILLCIIPAMLYLKAFGFRSKMHGILCIIDILIGIFGVCLMVALYFVV